MCKKYDDHVNITCSLTDNLITLGETIAFYSGTLLTHHTERETILSRHLTNI